MKHTENTSSIHTDSIMKGRVKDAPYHHWVYRLLPVWAWPYAQLARWDRPIGWKLLMWPCFWSLFLALGSPILPENIFLTHMPTIIWYLFLFFIGSVAMRGAGCTWNDLVDHKIDNMVARTRSRPLPSERVSRLQAKIFMGCQCLIGLFVLLQFNLFSIFLGFSSLIIVALYPFMKRVTDWPQFFLGLAFNWGALIGWSSIYEALDIAPILLYVGAVLWTIGYDTIYAHQDKEDDALVGVRSTARLFGAKTSWALSLLYGGFLLFTSLSFYFAALPWYAFLGIVAAGMHMFLQIFRIDINNDTQCLKLFKSNTHVGALIFLGLIAAALTP
ncbi:4-hydroxybenzoate octaprenyltransferase [Bartonella tamiae]|nr:4-hydroxybenzoate octaprenyltransferase [Bartonella tamiae]